MELWAYVPLIFSGTNRRLSAAGRVLLQRPCRDSRAYHPVCRAVPRVFFCVYIYDMTPEHVIFFSSPAILYVAQSRGVG